MIPGEYLLGHDPIEINAGRPTRRLEVSNTGDRPVQVGSHFHFLEVNRSLVFDRAAAYGMRLNIASGTAVRFEPGDTREVELVAIGGSREVIGLNRLVDGALDAEAIREATLVALDRFAVPAMTSPGRAGEAIEARGTPAPRRGGGSRMKDTRS